MIVKWAITNDCNLKCKHCYNAHLRKHNPVLTLEGAKSTIYEMKKNHVSNIQFTGGEPLLYPHLIDIMNTCSSLGISTWVNTNGTLLDKVLSQSLISAGVDVFVISLDGPNGKLNDMIRGEGSFERTMEGLGNLLSCKTNSTNVYINSVLSREGVIELASFLDFCDWVGLEGITIGLPDITGNALKQKANFWPDYNLFFDHLLEFVKMVTRNTCNISLGVPPLLKWFFDKNYGTKFFEGSVEYCMGGSSVLFIDADSVMYPCCLPTGIEYFREKYSYAHLQRNCSLKSRSFSDIYSRKEYLEFFQYVRARDLSSRQRFSESICGVCPFAILNYYGISCPLSETPYSYKALCDILIEKESTQIMTEALLDLKCTRSEKRGEYTGGL